MDWSNISSKSDIAVYDENDNLLDYYFETFDATNQTAVIWVYRNWVRDGSTQAQIAYGSGPSDQSVTKETVFDKESNLQAGYLLNENSGSAKDITSNNNDGTVKNGVSQGITGQVGNAYKLDGQDDHIRIPDFSTFSSYTISFWSYHNSVNDGDMDECIAMYSHNEIVMGEWGNGIFKLYQRYDHSGYSVTDTIKNDKWNHWVGTWNGSSITLYKNGNLVGNTPVSGTMDRFNTTNDGIGADLTNNVRRFLDGKIDELRIYNTSLPSFEITAFHDATKSTPDFFSQEALTLNKDLTVSGDLAITGEIDINGKKLTVQGDLDNNGTITSNGGEIEFTGSSDSYVSGSNITLYDLTINKSSADVVLQNLISVSGDMTITAGGINPNGNEIEFTGSSDSYVSGSNITLYGLTINKLSANVILQNDISISHTATFNSGHVDAETNNQTLIFQDGASATGAGDNSYVNGKVKKIGDDDFMFPIGDNVSGTDYYAALTVNNSNGTTTDEFTARYYHAENSNYSDFTPHNNLERIRGIEYWNLSRVTGSSTPEVTLHWDDGGESGIDDPTTLRVVHWDNSNSEWENLSNTGTTGSGGSGNSGSVTSGQVSNFSPFTFGTTSSSADENTFPVQLLNFEATCLDGSEAKISWSTATEINNDHFEVQLSEDGQNFETAEVIQGAGNSNEKQSYETVIDIEKQVQYVRLKQVDFDGQTEIFDPEDLNCHFRKNTISVYPNPVQDQLTIDFARIPESGVNVSVFTPQGKRVHKAVQKPETNRMKLNLDELPSGIYFVRIRNDEQQIIKKITK